MTKPTFLTDHRTKRKDIISELDKSSLVAERKAHQENVRRRTMRSDETKIEVVKTYLALGGNLALTSASTSISYDTLKTWKTSAWWKTLVTEIKQEETLELSAKTKKILNNALDILADRVSNGDFIYDQKAGKLVRKPIGAKDAHSISVDLIDRVQMLEKTVEAKNDVEEKSKTDLILEDLAQKFTLIANQMTAKPVVNVTDVVYMETNSAKNEERKA